MHGIKYLMSFFMRFKLFYVYFLRSLANPTKTYIGYTNNLVRRLDEHNSGQSHYTSRFMPWELRAYAMADSEEIAIAAEKFFKNSSGQEKLTKFREANPEHINPVRGYFESLEAGRKFGRSSFEVKEKSGGTIVFTACE